MITDAGGVAVAGGRMRTGAAYRLSGGLADPTELARVEAANLECIVDLRGADEDRSAVSTWAGEHGVTYVTEPIPAGNKGGVVELINGSRDRDEAMRELAAIYRRMVVHNGPQIAGTIGALVGRSVTGYGCAAGKDRTGVVTALLHILLGATEEDAIARYLSDAPEPERLHVLVRGYLELGADDPLPEAAIVFCATWPETMRATLGYLEEEFGGVVPYLLHHGLPADAPAALRAQLVVPD